MLIEKIKELITEKFGELEADQLDHIAGKLAKKATTEEEVTKQVEELTTKELMQSYADMRVNKATTKKEPKGGKETKTDTTKQDPVDPKENDDDDTPAWAKALIEQNKALADKVNRMEGDKIKEMRTVQVEELIKDLPETMQKAYKRMSIETLSAEDFAELLTEVEEEVKTTIDEIRKSGGTFSTPKHKGIEGTESGKPKEDTKEDVEAIFEALS